MSLNVVFQPWQTARWAHATAAVWHSLVRLVVACLVVGATPAWAQPDTVPIWMMRHALAPGYGDPSDMVLGRCETQRTLNDVGRSQAQAAGAWLKARGLSPAEVLASPWCRTMETAALLGVGQVAAHPGLASFFQRGDAQTIQAALVQRVQQYVQGPMVKPLVLVTHQVNISAYTGRGVASGEILEVRVNAAGQAVSQRSVWLPN